jgi:photosystem II stability/assembly factor-like uncharacterized protein
VDAALVTPRFGWVLTRADLLLTRDGGDTLVPAPVNLGRDTPRAAFFRDERNGWVAAAGPGAITVARTTDGGASWRTTTIPTATEISVLSLAAAKRGQPAMLARSASSAAFSRAHLYTTGDGGASWAKRPAPVAGELAVERSGRIWLAGGAQHDRLYSTADGGRRWIPADVRLPAGAALTSVSIPVAGVVQAAVTKAGRPRVLLLRPRDPAGPWIPIGALPATAASSGLPPAGAPAGGRLVFADPAGGRLYGAGAAGTPAAAGVTERTASGLPPGATGLTFAGEHAGWALTSAGRCGAGKQNCSLTASVVATRDGGATWRTVVRWQQRIN